MLDLVFKGQAFFDGMPRGIPMVLASCVRIIQLWERGLEDLPGSYYGQLIGDEGRQEVFIRHWEWGEFWNWLRGKFLVVLELPAGRVVFGVGTWGASLWVGALGCTGVELEAFPA